MVHLLQFIWNLYHIHIFVFFPSFWDIHFPPRKKHKTFLVCVWKSLQSLLATLITSDEVINDIIIINICSLFFLLFKKIRSPRLGKQKCVPGRAVVAKQFCLVVGCWFFRLFTAVGSRRSIRCGCECSRAATPLLPDDQRRRRR